MADAKITALTALLGTDVADGDLFAIVDVSAGVTKKITADEARTALVTAEALAALGIDVSSAPLIELTRLELTGAVGQNTVEYYQIAAAPTGAESVQPVLAGAGAGNLSNGVYLYKFTSLTGDILGTPGETTGSAASLSVTVVDHTANGKVKVPDLHDFLNVAINPFCVGVRIYRTSANGSDYKYVGLYPDGDFIDNVADGSRGATLPSTNTSGQIGLYMTPGDGVNVLSRFTTAKPTNPASKFGDVGAITDLQSTDWLDYQGNFVHQRSFILMYSATPDRDGRITITSEKFNLAFDGTLTAIFPSADPHVAGAGYWDGATFTKSAG